MVVPTFKYCYFQFDNGHSLRAMVTPCLDLEWTLYIGDTEVGRFLDEKTNVLLHKQLSQALHYIAVVQIYDQLLPKPTP